MFLAPWRQAVSAPRTRYHPGHAAPAALFRVKKHAGGHLAAVAPPGPTLGLCPLLQRPRGAQTQYQRQRLLQTNERTPAHCIPQQATCHMQHGEGIK